MGEALLEGGVSGGWWEGSSARAGSLRQTHVSKPWRISYRSKDNLWAQSSLRTPSVIEGEWRRSALPGNQSAFQHLAHVYSFSFLKPFKTGRFFFFFLYIYFSLQSEFTLNPELKLQHMVRISTREGTSVCLFCSWHLLLLTYAGSCPALISFSKWIAEQRPRCDESSKCNFCPAKKRKTIKRLTVYILLAARSLC